MNDEQLTYMLNTFQKRLDAHSKEIDDLKQDSAVLKTELKNLCADIKSLTAMLKWFITAICGAFISFFFYAIQSNIF